MENFDESHTAIADNYEEQAEAVDPTTNHPNSSWYDRLMEQIELRECARVHQDEVRKIFKEIAKEGSSMLPDCGMLRTGVLTVSRGKALFSTDQFVEVCEHMFDKLPFVAFKGPADARP